MEMADAYATLANGGSHYPATIIRKVVFSDGSVAHLGDTHPKRVFPYGQSYAATQVLKTVITSGTGTAANYGCPAAGKTGTAENQDNAWFVGYTPKLSTAVWVGYPQGNIGLGSSGFGGVLAAPIWHDFMESASNGYCGDWTPPTVPWTGTPFVGPHSSPAPAPPAPVFTAPSSSGGGSFTPHTGGSHGGSAGAPPAQHTPAPAGGGGGGGGGGNGGGPPPGHSGGGGVGGHGQHGGPPAH
jgi:penicillin-binding protein 1A